jgi:hypothetical protein
MGRWLSCASRSPGRRWVSSYDRGGGTLRFDMPSGAAAQTEPSALPSTTGSASMWNPMVWVSSIGTHQPMMRPGSLIAASPVGVCGGIERALGTNTSATRWNKLPLGNSASRIYRTLIGVRSKSMSGRTAKASVNWMPDDCECRMNVCMGSQAFSWICSQLHCAISPRVMLR